MPTAALRAALDLLPPRWLASPDRSQRQEVRVVVRISNRRALLLGHGGSNAESANAQYVLERPSGLAGFHGASGRERLPTAVALTDNRWRFQAVSVASA
jgi:predicted TIM-barrel enzyme